MQQVNHHLPQKTNSQWRKGAASRSPRNEIRRNILHFSRANQGHWPLCGFPICSINLSFNFVLLSFSSMMEIQLFFPQTPFLIRRQKFQRRLRWKYLGLSSNIYIYVSLVWSATCWMAYFKSGKRNLFEICYIGFGPGNLTSFFVKIAKWKRSFFICKTKISLSLFLQVKSVQCFNSVITLKI